MIGGRSDGAEVVRTGPTKATQKSTGGYAARRQARSAVLPSAARAVSPGGLSGEDALMSGHRSEGEVSGSEEEVPRSPIPARVSERSAGGIAPVQPGEYPLSLPIGGGIVLAGAGGAVSAGSQEVVEQGSLRTGGAVRAESGLLGFLAGIKELVGRFEHQERAAAGPAAAWVPSGGVSGGVAKGTEVVVPAVAGPAGQEPPVPIKASSGSESSTSQAG